MEEQKSSKKKKRFSISGVFLTLGLLMILAGLGLVLYNYNESERAGESSDQAVEAIQEVIDAQEEDPATDAEDTDPDDGTVPEMDTVTIDGYDYIGYIEAPSLGMTLSVMAECDENRLKISPCRYSGNLYSNDLVIAGHNYRRHFSPFRSLPVGAEIDFIDVHGNRYQYEIVETEALQPTEVARMVEKNAQWDLSLYTCTIGGKARYTIRCRRV